MAKAKPRAIDPVRERIATDFDAYLARYLAD